VGDGRGNSDELLQNAGSARSCNAEDDWTWSGGANKPGGEGFEANPVKG